MNYRPEINGLRAIAVIPILLFHANIIQSGYLGVDVFFVISGYLITGVLINGIETKTFSFADFYEHRARRILPTLFLVCFATIPFAILFMKNWQLLFFGQSIVATVFFVSNMYFQNQLSYFSPDDTLFPLLHTWSLGVEEQFYILFPIFIFLICKYAKKYLLTIICVIGIGSLIFASWMSVQDSASNFYLLPSRIWELMLGALIYYPLNSSPLQHNKTLNAIMPSSGMLLIAGSMIGFQISTPHPSFYTLIPTIGAAIIIWFGGKGDICSRLLSSKLLVGIGVISYSIYLWHQPILVFLRFHNAGQLSDFAQFFYIPITLVVAYLSWLYIEKPFLNQLIISKTKLLYTLFAAALLLIILGLTLYFYTRIHRFLTLPESVITSLTIKPDTNCSYSYDSEKLRDAQLTYCSIGEPNAKLIDFAIIGDSHSDDLINPFKELANEANMNGVAATAFSCYPILDLETDTYLQSLFKQWRSNDKNLNTELRMCTKLNREMFNFVKEHKIRDVIFISIWVIPSQIKREYEAVATSLANTIKQYNDIGTNVTIILPTPIQNQPAEDIYEIIYSKPSEDKNKLLHDLSVSRSQYLTYKNRAIALFKADTNLSLADPEQYYCNSDVCPVGTPNYSFYRDSNHLSKQGADKIKPLVKQILEHIKR